VGGSLLPTSPVGGSLLPTVASKLAPTSQGISPKSSRFIVGGSLLPTVASKLAPTGGWITPHFQATGQSRHPRRRSFGQRGGAQPRRCEQPLAQDQRVEFTQQNALAGFGDAPHRNRRRCCSQRIERALATAEAAQRRQYRHRPRHNARQARLADAELPLQPRRGLRAMACQKFLQGFRGRQHTRSMNASP
jgi:hypothetical protein